MLLLVGCESFDEERLPKCTGDPPFWVEVPDLEGLSFPAAVEKDQVVVQFQSLIFEL